MYSIQSADSAVQMLALAVAAVAVAILVRICALPCGASPPSLERMSCKSLKLFLFSSSLLSVRAENAFAVAVGVGAGVGVSPDPDFACVSACLPNPWHCVSGCGNVWQLVLAAGHQVCRLQSAGCMRASQPPARYR